MTLPARPLVATLLLMLLESGCIAAPIVLDNKPDTGFRPVYQSYFTGKSTYDQFYEKAGTGTALLQKIEGAIVPHHLFLHCRWLAKRKRSLLFNARKAQ